MGDNEDLINRICNNCNVCLMEPHNNPDLYRQGIYRCGFCGYSKVIDKEKIENRVRYQK